MAKQPQVYVVSDSLGETAESVAKATIGQYDTDIEIHRVPFIRHTDQIEKIIDEAAQAGAVVCHTLVSPELRADFERIAHEKNVRYVDILGPMMNMVTDVAGVQPRMKPGIIHRLDEEYFKKVEAIEFAVRYDDGKKSGRLRESGHGSHRCVPHIKDTAVHVYGAQKVQGGEPAPCAGSADTGRNIPGASLSSDRPHY